MEPTSRLIIDFVETMMMLMMTRLIYYIPCQRNYSDPGPHSPSCGAGMECQVTCSTILAASGYSVLHEVAVLIEQSNPSQGCRSHSIASQRVSVCPAGSTTMSKKRSQRLSTRWRLCRKGRKWWICSQVERLRLVVVLLAHVPDDNCG